MFLKYFQVKGDYKTSIESKAKCNDIIKHIEIRGRYWNSWRFSWLNPYNLTAGERKKLSLAAVLYGDPKVCNKKFLNKKKSVISVIISTDFDFRRHHNRSKPRRKKRNLRNITQIARIKNHNFIH